WPTLSPSRQKRRGKALKYYCAIWSELEELAKPKDHKSGAMGTPEATAIAPPLVPEPAGALTWVGDQEFGFAAIAGEHVYCIEKVAAPESRYRGRYRASCTSIWARKAYRSVAQGYLSAFFEQPTARHLNKLASHVITDKNSLTQKGPVATAAEAKAICEADY